MKNLSARNPLGIIALFISLIYGISALLLGVSVDKISTVNQERLVWFIIAFPIGILFAFLYLVTWHHRKLYSPADFRTDEGFLTSADPSAIGRKYLAEGKSAEDNTGIIPELDEISLDKNAADGATAGPGSVKEDGQTTREQGHSLPQVRSAPSPNPAEFAAYAYMIEGLVMQELQNEYKSSIRRDAAFPTANGRFARVDGLIEAPTGPIIVEIKLVRPKSEFKRRMREAFSQLRSLINSAREVMDRNSSGILILVLDGNFTAEQLSRLEHAAGSSQESDISVRIFMSEDLMKKYGFSSPFN